MKCWITGHDYVVIKSLEVRDCLCPKTIRVCIKCKNILDTIAPHQTYLREQKEAKETRLQKAQRIYANRYNPNA